MPHAHETDRVSDSHRHDFLPDTGIILQQITPDDIRASHQRQTAERHRDAEHPALPHLEICDARHGSPVSQIMGLPYDHNGHVTVANLERSLNDPNFLHTYPCAGAAAASMRNHFDAVAALHNDGDNHDISLNDVIALQRSRPNDPLVRSMNNEMAAVHNYGQNEGLFDRGGRITPDAVRQGHLGDCTLMATFASLANSDRGRQFIRHMFQPNGDDFRVHFGNGQTIETPRPTPLEMGTYGFDSRHGLWPNVGERAYGMARSSDLIQNVVDSFNGRPNDPLRPQASMDGLSAPEVFSNVFGNRANRVEIPLASVSYEQLHTQLASISPGALAMVTNTPPGSFPSDNPPGHFPFTMVDRSGGPTARDYLRPNHSYMFDHYDAQAREVYLRNPWHGNEVLRMPLKTYHDSFLNFDAVL